MEDMDMELTARRTEDVARRVGMEVAAQVAAYNRQALENLEKLLNERFQQVHTDLKQHSAKLEDLLTRVQGLDKQSALNGRDLDMLKRQVSDLSEEVHGVVIPRVRELEKANAGSAPVIAGTGKVAMTVIIGVVMAALGWLLGKASGG